MPYRLAADAILLLHGAFVLFAVFGGLLVLRWRRAMWLHLPAAAWGVAVEASGALCPLTTWENRFRRAAGDAGYDGSFVERYLLPLIYPEGLTREVQWWLAGAVLVINLLVYAAVFCYGRRLRGGGTGR